MTYKLIASDLDETLLDDDHRIPQRVLDAVRAARELGVRFVPSTGRPANSVTPTLDELGLLGSEEDYTLSFNGGVLVRDSDLEAPLTSCSLDWEKARAVYALGVAEDVCMHIYTPERTYIYKFVDDERRYLANRWELFETSERTLDFLAGEQIVKIIFMSDLDDLARIEAEAAEKGISDGLDVCYSGNRYLEFNAPGINKGAGLLALAERLGIAREETIAVGDNSNDVSMIAEAGLGCAVANATDEAKAAAGYVCQSDNNAGAVAEVIEKFVLGA